MSSVNLVVTEVGRLKDVIACLKGENAALKEELAQHRITQVKSSAIATAEQIAAIIQTAEGFVKLGCPYKKLYELVMNDLRQLLLT